MAEREVESAETEVPEIPEVLESALLFTLDEAKEKMRAGETVVPFTAVVTSEGLYVETHPGSTAEECLDEAARVVGEARGASAYALCYDGYVEVDEGTRDALIAEGGMSGEEAGYAACYLYELDEDGRPVFEEEAAYIGQAPNFMAGLPRSATA